MDRYFRLSQSPNLSLSGSKISFVSSMLMISRSLAQISVTLQAGLHKYILFFIYTEATSCLFVSVFNFFSSILGRVIFYSLASPLISTLWYSIVLARFFSGRYPNIRHISSCLKKKYERLNFLGFDAFRHYYISQAKKKFMSGGYTKKQKVIIFSYRALLISLFQVRKGSFTAT